MVLKVPWWRRVFDFALDGIRTGLGWFSRNGKPQAAAQFEVETEYGVTEPEPIEVEKPAVVLSEDVAVEVVPVETASPEEIETEVIRLEIVAAEVENQEEESALTDSSPQHEANPPEAIRDEAAPAEPISVEATPAKSEPDAVAVAAHTAELPDAALEGPSHPDATPEVPGQPISTGPVEESPAQAQPVAAAELTREEKTAEKVAAALKARGQDAEQSPFSVIVNQVYDGPLDLLLDLIRKQDIDIYDIPIAQITAQFLAYVDRLKASDMDVAGDFIYTAALLIHIKSKVLLPRAPAGPDEATDDPRRELVERLLEHERFKNAAQMLHEKQMLEAATWTNPGAREFREDEGAEPEIAADTTDLVRIFRDILERARNRPIMNVQEDTVTVGQMIQFLARRLTMEDKPVALRRLLSHTKSERALIAMFLALLELVRLQAILLRQDRHFSEIFIKKHTGFEAVMNQGLADARDDWR
jgi:segregation and condensation protein A